MKIHDNSLEFLFKIEDTCQLKIGKMLVEMAYPKNNRSLDECMLSILKQKVKIRS